MHDKLAFSMTRLAARIFPGRRRCKVVLKDPMEKSKEKIVRDCSRQPPMGKPLQACALALLLLPMTSAWQTH